MKPSWLAVGVFSLASALCASETTIDSSKLVQPSDTTIDAIIAVKEAADAALKAPGVERVNVLPLPSGSPRNDAFNREMPWLSRGKLKWKGPARTGGDSEDGSHLFRIEQRGQQKDFPWWYERLKEKRDAIRAAKGAFDVVMLGDSITHWWERHFGLEVWPDLCRTYSMLNLGYGGDKADTLLWRVRNGELDGYKAKVFTILIGTNNNTEGRDTPERTAKTIDEIVSTVRTKQPQAKILLMALFPRSSPEQGRFRARGAAVSRLIEKLADGENVIWCDFRPLVTKEDGSGRYDLLEDGTHPSPSGLRVWRDALLPYFERYTGKRHTPQDRFKEPCARRWYYYRVDAAEEAAVVAFNNFAVRAHWIGYNGVCADFNCTTEWNAAAEKRVRLAVDTCRDLELKFVPVLELAGASNSATSAATLERIRQLADPEVVFLSTNGCAAANRNDLRLTVIKEIVRIKKTLPKAEVVLWGQPFYGFGAGISSAVTMAATNHFDYYRKAKWSTMMVIDAGDKSIQQYNLHAPIAKFMRSYRAHSPRDGFLYWTADADYRLLLDAVRLAMRQE